MLAIVKGRIGRAFMHILFVHYSAVLLADAPFIAVTRVYCARLTGPCSGITTELWLRATRSPVVHACPDPHLPVLLSVLLSDPCPTAVLVINGLGHRSPRIRKNLVDSFVVAPRRN